MPRIGETSPLLECLTQYGPTIELYRRIDDATRRTAYVYHRATETAARMHDETRRRVDSGH